MYCKLINNFNSNLYFVFYDYGISYVIKILYNIKIFWIRGVGYVKYIYWKFVISIGK